MSSESAPRSLVKLAPSATSLSSTPSLSTIIDTTLDLTSDISFFFKVNLRRKENYKQSKNKIIIHNIQPPHLLFFSLNQELKHHLQGVPQGLTGRGVHFPVFPVLC